MFQDHLNQVLIFSLLILILIIDKNHLNDNNNNRMNH